MDKILNGRNLEKSEALNSLPDEWKAIDILINNAGLVIGTDKEKALLAITRMIVPGMIKSGIAILYKPIQHIYGRYLHPYSFL